MTTIKTITAAFALTASLVAPAMAASAATPSSAKVTYADLNLSTEQGRDVFDMRIKRAIQDVCGRTTGKIGMDQAVKQCRRDTMAAAKQSRDLAIADYDAKRFAAADRKVIRLVAQ